jgi:hypothetical protein
MKKILLTFFCAAIISFGLATFAVAARSQYGYLGIYNSSPFTLTTGDGSAVSVDANGYVKMSTSSQLSSLSIGSLFYKELYENITASNTITVAESGKTFYLSGAASTSTLPATSTAAGTVYRFVVSGAVSGNIVIITSDGGNDIEGALIVAGAVVDCDAEDTITIVADGENIGDFFELRSAGGDWFIGASGGLSADKITCTAS